MSKYVFVWLLVSGSIGFGYAQEIQWASKVLGVSSEFTKETAKTNEYGQEFKATQALGYPNTAPPFGQTPCAWSPHHPDSGVDDWIKVGFAKPQRAKYLVIVENFNAGCLTKIYGYTADNREILLAENPSPNKAKGRVLNLPLPDSSLALAAIKLVLNTSLVSGYNQIDAIGLSSFPFEASIRVVKDAPTQIIKENLGSGINTRAMEIAPNVTADGKTIFFTRADTPTKSKKKPTKEAYQDVWYSTLRDGKWSKAQNIGPPINNANHNAVVGVSPDGKTLYLMNIYRPDGTMVLGLSKSVRTKTGWTRPVECKIEDINNFDSHADFTISPKGDVIIMSLKLPDTQGSRDLYVSFLRDNGTWSKPKNMGTVLNTAAQESTPFIANDNSTMYFTSYGHAGYGDGDIFVSRRLDGTWLNWSLPENLGPNINTKRWDSFLSIPVNGDYAYISSQKTTSRGEDIFRFKMHPAIRPEPMAVITGSVVNAKTKKPINAKLDLRVMLKDSSDSLFTHLEYEPEIGDYQMVVPIKAKYRISATEDGYFAYTDNIDLTRDNNYREIRQSLPLQPIEAGTKITLHSVMFEQSRFDLQPASLPELNQMVKLLQEYPNMEILLEGHTDNQGDLNLNVKLSEDRVNEVKKYFVSKGISEDRIQLKAWGPTRPVANNELEESRRRNRRVEFTILKM